MAAEFRRDTARGVFWIGFALGIFPEDASSRLNLTTTTPYHATGLSQCESMTRSGTVAESSITPWRNIFSASQRETPPAAIPVS